MKITINTSSAEEYDAILQTLTDIELIRDAEKACELINKSATIENNAFSAKLNSCGNDLEIEINEKVVFWVLRFSKRFFKIAQILVDLITDSIEEVEDWFNKPKVTFAKPFKENNTEETNDSNAVDEHPELTAIYNSIQEIYRVFPGIEIDDLKKELELRGYSSDDINLAVEWVAL